MNFISFIIDYIWYVGEKYIFKNKIQETAI